MSISTGLPIAIVIIAIALLAGFILSRKRKKTAQAQDKIKPPLVNSTPVPVEIKAPVASAPQPVSVPVVDASPQVSAGIPGSARILLIEDDHLMLLAVKNILNKAGYITTIARDRKDAFEQIEIGNYDIVITDLMLPFANGLEILTKLRSDATKRDVGIIVCSSVRGEETVSNAFRLGADAFLNKPIISEELLSRIRQILDKKKNQPQLVTRKRHLVAKTV
jgi:PleD family two-component response regulator